MGEGWGHLENEKPKTSITMASLFIKIEIAQYLRKPLHWLRES
jgi:hypothetical protein